MSDPHDRPGRSERRAATRAIETAFAVGRIVAADRDLRLAQVEHAATFAELEVLTRDLRLSTADPWTGGPPAQTVAPPSADPFPVVPDKQPAGTPAPRGRPASPQPPQPPQPSRPSRPQAPQGRNPYAGYTGRSSSARIVVVPLLVVVVLVAVAVPAVIAIFALSSATRTVSPPSPVTTRRPDTSLPALARTTPMRTAAAIEKLFAAIEGETGRTRVYDLTVYPDYAIVRAPRSDGRVGLYRWGGTLVEISDQPASATFEAVDVAAVEPRVLLATLADAERRWPDGESGSYVTLRRTPFDDGVVYAYVSGEGYVSAKADGTRVRVVPF